ncbi:MAG: copper resistance protein CopC [Caldilineaceae bacterium]|nr:copper resistance protein CopC [Caldilineaceae bacterium]
MNFTQMRRRIAKLLGLAMLLATIHFPLSTAVLAHADYDHSVPAADELVLQAPQQVQVWFTQELFRREGQNSLEVYGPDEQRVDLDDFAIDDDDRKLMTVSLPPDLANGVYTVRWRSLSADDGDDASGEFQFTIQSDEPTAEAAATETPESTTEAAQPSPTNTAQPEQAEPRQTPSAADTDSEVSETSPDQPDQGPGLPCLGSSIPLLLLLGGLLIGRGHRYRRKLSPHARRGQNY